VRPDVPVVQLPFGGTIYLRIDDTALQQELDLLLKQLDDPRPMWREIATIMRRSFATTFKVGGRPRWAPLKRGTVTAKKVDSRIPYSSYNGVRMRARIRRLEQARAEGSSMMARSSRNILIATGALRDSWAQKSADHVERISKERLEEGSKNRVASIHEFGTGIYGSRHSPFIIRPQRARALRFWGPGGIVFAKSVENPGVPARPVLGREPVHPEDIEKIDESMLRHLRGEEQPDA
jgi:phage gpG-like protein